MASLHTAARQWLTAGVILALCVVGRAQDAPSIAGTWAGTLVAGPTRLRLAFHLNVDRTDGGVRGTLDSLDQRATIPLSAGSLRGADVRLELATIGATFEGQLSSDGRQIIGVWRQGAGSLSLTLTRSETAVTLPRRAQEPTPPYPYTEHQVTIENRASQVTLAGTFTHPPGSARTPAVVLITGSGAQDRDESIAGHRPFLVLADHLTRAGIAVLRMDDRGVGGSSGELENATSGDLASDIAAAVAALASRPDVDPTRIGLIGHSEGALIAPIVAASRTDVAFLVMLAGTGLPGEDILYLQGAAIARALGATDAQIAANRTQQQTIITIVKEESDSAAARARLAEWRDGLLASIPDPQRAAARAQLDAQIRQVTSRWFRFFLTYDPRPMLAKVRVPVLALIGDLDLQVPAAENLQVLEAALKSGGNADVTARRLPSLNHLFQTAKTGAPTEYAQIDETFAPSALDLISGWIRQRTQ